MIFHIWYMRSSTYIVLNSLYWSRNVDYIIKYTSPIKITHFHPHSIQTLENKTKTGHAQRFVYFCVCFFFRKGWFGLFIGLQHTTSLYDTHSPSYSHRRRRCVHELKHPYKISKLETWQYFLETQKKKLLKSCYTLFSGNTGSFQGANVDT